MPYTEFKISDRKIAELGACEIVQLSTRGNVGLFRRFFAGINVSYGFIKPITVRRLLPLALPVLCGFSIACVDTHDLSFKLATRHSFAAGEITDKNTFGCAVGRN